MHEHRDEDLTLFQPLFAIAMSIGFLDLANTVFAAWTKANQDVLPQSWAVIVTVLAAGLLLVALRMTWAVASLSRFIAARRALGGEHCVNAYCVTLWHYPALLGQGFAIFVLCRIVALVTDANRIGDSIIPFFAVLTGLLFFNAIYLYTVLPSKAAAAQKDANGMPCDGGRKIKIGWIINNLAFVIFTAGFLIVSTRAGWNPSDSYVIGPLVAAMFANSLLDLGFAAPYYVPRA
jgi:hypothetical protein